MDDLCQEMIDTYQLEKIYLLIFQLLIYMID
jgi:hypothetical protein